MLGTAARVFFCGAGRGAQGGCSPQKARQGLTPLKNQRTYYALPALAILSAYNVAVHLSHHHEHEDRPHFQYAPSSLANSLARAKKNSYEKKLLKKVCARGA